MEAPLYDIGRVTFRTKDGEESGYIMNLKNPQIMSFPSAPQWGYDRPSDDDEDDEKIIISITGSKSGKWNYAVRYDNRGGIKWVQEDDVVDAVRQEHDGYFINVSE